MERGKLDCSYHHPREFLHTAGRPQRPSTLPAETPRNRGGSNNHVYNQLFARCHLTGSDSANVPNDRTFRIEIGSSNQQSSSTRMFARYIFEHLVRDVLLN